jgi:predicted TPR repeat methyltransferase
VVFTDKKSLIDYYDKIADNYFYLEEQKIKWQEIKEYLFNSKLNLNKKTIIDLGCGIGLIRFLKIENTKKIGLDISFKSLLHAKKYYDFVINCDLDRFCFKKFNNKEFLIISVSSLQNLEENTIKKILSLDCFQIHSVMYRSKGEEYWVKLFKEKGFKFVKKVKNDLIFSNF